MIDVKEVLNLHATTVERWHREPLDNPYRGFLQLVCQQHQFNYLLWHEEDIARSPDVGDLKIAAVKRAIDKYNQQRNDAIEKLDDFLIGQIAAVGVRLVANASQNTETPGGAIDRLSIMALRKYHLEEQAARTDATPEHREKVAHRLLILGEQIADLASALAELLEDIFSGRKRMKVYRQFKMYNDPSMNPYLYQRSERKAG